ncbi:MAG: hypothetical protein ACR2Q4_11190 [Geminicoccaceae bacterium]
MPFRTLGLFAVMLIAGCSAGRADTEACIPTEADALGPFYVAGTALVDDLNRFAKSGEALMVEGEIRSSSADQPPIADADIEVWQTDGDGDYYPENNGHVDDYRDEDIDLRGTVRSDAGGIYRFRTLVPGAYVPRPRHFHYRITAPGFQTLVTQVYVTGDGFLSQPGGSCRHAPIVSGGEGLFYQAPTIYLQPG